MCKMTKPLLRKFFQGFTNDPSVFPDLNRFYEFIYREAEVDARWEKQRELGRIHLAVMLDTEPIGEVILKNVNAKEATLSIHMKNDHFKNRGFGTQAESLTLEYGFQNLQLETIYADTIHKNKRSQHVLEKVGFQKVHNDDQFVYYRCDKESWQRSQQSQKSGHS